MTAPASDRDTPADVVFTSPAERFDRDACGCECALPFLTHPQFAPCDDLPARRNASSAADDS